MKKLKAPLLKAVWVPDVKKVDQENYAIEMEYVEGPKLKDYLNQ